MKAVPDHALYALAATLSLAASAGATRQHPARMAGHPPRGHGGHHWQSSSSLAAFATNATSTALAGSSTISHSTVSSTAAGSSVKTSVSGSTVASSLSSYAASSASSAASSASSVASSASSAASSAAASSTSSPTSNSTTVSGTSIDTANALIVNMFQWPYTSIASECEFLASAGYTHVQISVPSESAKGTSWATDYAPVSYILTSKHGTEDELKSMVSTCAASGISVIADAVINHMSASSGTGIAGSTFTKYSYPAVPYTSSSFHYCEGSVAGAVETTQKNATSMEQCELDSLADLAQEEPAVTSAITAYLNSLLDLGIVGFRLDASAYIESSILSGLISGLSKDVMVTQEVRVDPSGAAAIQPDMYTGIGLVQGFDALYDLKTMFTPSTTTGIYYMAQASNPWGTGWGLTLDSADVNVFVTNHDTERDGSSLNYLSPNNAYALATYWLLAFDYGTPTVFSGYNFTDTNAGAPQSSAGFTDAVTCGSNGFRCEHRYNGFANMATFRKAALGTAVTNVAKGDTANQVAFGRGEVGFIAINLEDSSWTQDFTSSLPAGDYCEIIHDALTGCSSPITVASDGTFSATVASYDAIALVAQ